MLVFLEQILGIVGPEIDNVYPKWLCNFLFLLESSRYLLLLLLFFFKTYLFESGVRGREWERERSQSSI